MKRLIIIGVVLINAGFTFAQNSEALIREMTGTVELKTNDSADWIAASPGDLIERATMISTGFKSTALLAVGDSTVLVRPLTRLSLENLLNQDNTETVNLGLQSGRIRADVKAPAGSRANFTVQSVIAVASVRGTIFELDAENLKVIEGLVRFEPKAARGRPVRVNAGHSSQIDTITGKAVNPIAKAEKDRRLPVLAGEKFVLATHSVEIEKTEISGIVTVRPDNYQE